MPRSWCALSTLALLACNQVPGADESLVVEERDVIGAFDSQAMGITVDPDGRVFVISWYGSLYEDQGGYWEHLWRNDVTGFYDVVALGDDRFAVTSEGQGWLLDLRAGTMTEHFCYLPDEGIREEEPPPQDAPTVEVANGITYDPLTDRIYAQVQTVLAQDRQRQTFSEIATFDRASGQELAFRPLSDARIAVGGLAPLAGNTLIGIDGRRLIAIDHETAETRDVMSFDELGFNGPTGLAIDRPRNRLWVLDDLSGRLFALDLAQVEALIDP